jgi:predicted enzyme related to lactoylglutathione lyase
MKTYPPGAPCWIDSEQPDPDAAVDFYSALFGWTFEDRLPPSAPGRYLIAALDGAEILGMASGSGPARWRTYLAVDDAEVTLAAAVAAGATAVGAPDDAGPAGRSASMLDPTGAAIDLWQPRARKGSAVVNAPGTWNWSNLHTAEVAAAERFYGEVFGWTAAPGPPVMWMLPGYADAETRARHAEAGVPEGFSDAIAWLIEEPGPSRWHVTFAVDDPDALAGRAVELGGTVVVEPSDAGSARLATLADPFGADFTVSHYNG